MDPFGCNDSTTSLSFGTSSIVPISDILAGLQLVSLKFAAPMQGSSLSEMAATEEVFDVVFVFSWSRET